MTPRISLIAEFLLLCVALPGFIIFGRHAPFMFAFLWGATGYCWLVLRLRYHEDLRHIWKWGAVTRKNMGPILIRWALASLFMFAFLHFYDPERMFGILRHNPGLIPALLFGYPVLSALPQEFIFCSFFFTRYRPFFGEGKRMILASAIAFGYAHMLYINPVAPTLSFLGGLIFAGTYAKTKSLALVTIEHALYGNSLFFIGLGWYFYSGAVPLN